MATSFGFNFWDIELRGFAPIGMLEKWNVGKMGFRKMGQWFIVKISLDR